MAVTDIDGNYTIEASGKERLRFSYVGYDDTDITVDGRKVVNIGMKTMENDLGEVVVIGYGTQRKADLTGAVGVVDMKEAKKTAATNIYEILQGQVPVFRFQQQVSRLSPWDTSDKAATHGRPTAAKCA